MRNQEWDSTLSNLYALHFAKLIFRLLRCDTVNGEAPLGVVDKTKMLASLFDANHVHKTSRVGHVGTNFAVYFDQTLHEDCFDLSSVECIFQPIQDFVSIVTWLSGQYCKLPVANEDDQWKTVTKFVRASRWAWSVSSGELVEKPMRWRAEALLMLLWSTRHIAGGVEDAVQVCKFECISKF